MTFFERIKIPRKHKKIVSFGFDRKVNEDWRRQHNQKQKKIEFDGCHFCDCCHWSKNKSCFFFFLKALCLFALFMAKKRRTINAFEKRPISSEKVDFKKQKLKKKKWRKCSLSFFSIYLAIFFIRFMCCFVSFKGHWILIRRVTHIGEQAKCTTK